MLDDSDEPTGLSCDCGALFVEGSWRGRAVMRCTERGTRWALEVRTAEEGSQRFLSPRTSSGSKRTATRKTRHTVTTRPSRSCSTASRR